MARSSSPNSGDSYYIVINGKKYDRRMLELAQGLTSGRGDGRISINDAKNLLRVVQDANNYSAIEKATMEYIRKKFKFTKEGDEYFRGEIRRWAATKTKKKSASKGKTKVAAPVAVANTEATAVSSTTSAAPAAASEEPAWAVQKKSPWKQILLALLLLLLIGAAFYFFAYKSSCAQRKDIPVTSQPSSEVKPLAAAQEAKAAPPPTAKPTINISPELKAKIESTRLTFVAEKTQLSRAGAKTVNALAKLLSDENVRLQVTGHTCSLGPKELNQKISQSRARVVKDALVARGIAAERIETRGVADSEPVADNKTIAGRIANRRVTFKVLD